MANFRKTDNPHADVINYFIEKHNYNSYLEIGASSGNTYKKIVGVDIKHGVDPIRHHGCRITHNMVSDRFFRLLDTNIKYDVIYVDGLHESHQVDRDLINALKHLSENGMIFLDDIAPVNHEWQVTPRIKRTVGWNGDVWKSYIKLRCTRPDLSMIAFWPDETTHSRMSIIRYGTQETIKDPIEQCLNYEYFDQNRERLLNIIPLKEALKS